MDLLTTRTMDVTKMAMDGLLLRQKAVMANTANVMTPDYQRKEVNFESQLRDFVERDDLKQQIKSQNSIQYNPTSLEGVMGFGAQPRRLSVQEMNYLQQETQADFAPQITNDMAIGDPESANNVDLEKEIMDMAKVGTQYNLLATLQQKNFRGMAEIIKGQV